MARIVRACALLAVLARRQRRRAREPRPPGTGACRCARARL